MNDADERHKRWHISGWMSRMFPGLARSDVLLTNTVSGLSFFGLVLLLFPLAITEPGQATALAAVMLAAIPFFLKGLGQAAPRLRGAERRLAEPATDNLPVVSIHVAIHDEPAAVVIRTLEALARLDYAGRFEVVVLDNNTPDPAAWLPVHGWCERHPEVFRFFHYDGVEGAKAGALNLALRHTRPDASLIALVDAGYVVEPDFLRRGVAALRDETLTHVQFPQAYRDVAPGHAAIEAELRHYFDTCARAANRHRAMLLTGTLSVIRRQALERLGGWPTDTITEDARLGSLLIEAGGHGLLLDEVAGRGLLPADLTAFSRQRHRWAAGNAQTLRLTFAGRSRGRSLPILIQLSAWLTACWLLLPLGLAMSVCYPESLGGPILLWGFLTLIAAELAVVLTSARGPLGLRIRAAIVRLAMLPEGTVGLASGLGFKKLCVVRTFKSRGRSDVFRRARRIVGTGLVAAAVALMFIDPLSSFSLLIAPVTLAARSWVSRELASSGAIAHREFAPEPPTFEHLPTSAS